MTIYTDLPNGYRDINPTNDTIVINFEIKQGDELNLSIFSDNYGEEISWQISNENEEIQFEENNLLSNQENEFQLCLDNDICYTLTIFDQQNDGICCDFGNGFIEVNNQYFSGEYNDELVLDLCQVIDTDEIYFKTEIYPNPSTGTIYIESEEFIQSIKVIDIQGKLLKKYNPNNRNLKLNFDFLDKGLYLLQLKTNKEYIIKKIILK